MHFSFFTLKQHDCKISTMTILLTRRLLSCVISPPPELPQEGQLGSTADVTASEASGLSEQLHAPLKNIRQKNPTKKM